MLTTQSHHLGFRAQFCRQMCNPEESGPVQHSGVNITSQEINRTESMVQHVPRHTGDATSIQTFTGCELFSPQCASQDIVKQAASHHRSSHRSHRSSHNTVLQQAALHTAGTDSSTIRETHLRPQRSGEEHPGNFHSSSSHSASILQQPGNPLEPHGIPIFMPTQQDCSSMTQKEQLHSQDPRSDPPRPYHSQTQKSHSSSAPPIDSMKTMGKHIAEALAAANEKLVDYLSAPKLSLMKYDGSAQNFHLFWISFLNLVDRKMLDPAHKLQILYSSLTGRAQTLVRCYLHEADPTEAYESAKKILKQKCGHPLRLSISVINNLTKGGKIGENDIDMFMQFSSDLHTAEIVFRDMNKQAELDNNQLLVKLWKRLPSSMQDMWTENIAKIQYQNEDYEPSFKEFCELVEKGILQRTLPGYCDSEIYGKNEVQKQKDTMKKDVPFSTQLQITHQKSEKKSKPYPICAACRSTGVMDNTHLLVHCEKFKSMSHQERLTITTKYRVCRNCVSFSSHLASKCRAPKRKCSIPHCKERHHTLFHFAHLILKEKWKEKEEPKTQVSKTTAKQTFISESVAASHGKIPAEKQSSEIHPTESADLFSNRNPKQHYPWFTEAYVTEKPQVTDTWKVLYTVNLQEIHISTETTESNISPRVKQAAMTYHPPFMDVQTDVSLTSAEIRYSDHQPIQLGEYSIIESTQEIQFRPKAGLISQGLSNHNGYDTRARVEQSRQTGLKTVAKDYSIPLNHPNQLKKFAENLLSTPFMKSTELNSWKNPKDIFNIFKQMLHLLINILMLGLLTAGISCW